MGRQKAKSRSILNRPRLQWELSRGDRRVVCQDARKVSLCGAMHVRIFGSALGYLVSSVSNAAKLSRCCLTMP